MISDLLEEQENIKPSWLVLSHVPSAYIIPSSNSSIHTSHSTMYLLRTSTTSCKLALAIWRLLTYAPRPHHRSWQRPPLLTHSALSSSACTTPPTTHPMLWTSSWTLSLESWINPNVCLYNTVAISKLAKAHKAEGQTLSDIKPATTLKESASSTWWLLCDSSIVRILSYFIPTCTVLHLIGMIVTMYMPRLPCTQSNSFTFLSFSAFLRCPHSSVAFCLVFLAGSSECSMRTKY